MKAMGISRDELAANLQMTHEELDALLTPTRDYTISEIRHLLCGHIGESTRGEIAYAKSQRIAVRYLE